MNRVPIDERRPSPYPGPGMTDAAYRRLVARGEKQAWSPEDEKRLREKVARVNRR